MRMRSQPIVTLLIGVLTVASSATVITVDDSGGADYGAIQPALDAAAHGDTVLVHPGDYFERIWMYDGIALIGSGPACTVIDGTGLPHSTVEFTVGQFGRDTRLEGFTITGGIGPGPWVCGVWLGPECSAVVRDNVITGNQIGVSCKSNAGTPLIEHNTIAYNQDGGVMVYENSGSPEIRSNIICFDGVYGVIRAGGVYPVLDYNCVYGNGIGYIDVYPGAHDILVNPLFCSPPDDLHIETTSPCAGAGEHGSDTGAFAAGCNSVAVQPVTWTGIKALYR